MSAGLSFGLWHYVTPDVPGWARSEWFGALRPSEQEECWQALAEECDRRLDERLHDPLLDYEPEPPKNRSPGERAQSPKARRPSCDRSPRARFENDPLRTIPAEIYVELLTGEEVGRSRKIRCPLHEENTPSFHVYDDHWNCFGCHRGGDIYTLAAELWGLATTGKDFLGLRQRLAERLLGRAA